MSLLNIINKKGLLLSKLDPNRIYVENIRSFFNIPSIVARYYCEMAVKQHFFKKKKGFICPNQECNRLVSSFDANDKIPDTIKCETCEHLERPTFEFSTDNPKDFIEFYQLIK